MTQQQHRSTISTAAKESMPRVEHQYFQRRNKLQDPATDRPRKQEPSTSTANNHSSRTHQKQISRNWNKSSSRRSASPAPSTSMREAKEDAKPNGPLGELMNIFVTTLIEPWNRRKAEKKTAAAKQRKQEAYGRRDGEHRSQGRRASHSTKPRPQQAAKEPANNRPMPNPPITRKPVPTYQKNIGTVPRYAVQVTSLPQIHKSVRLQRDATTAVTAEHDANRATRWGDFMRTSKVPTTPDAVRGTLNLRSCDVCGKGPCPGFSALKGLWLCQGCCSSNPSPVEIPPSYTRKPVPQRHQSVSNSKTYLCMYCHEPSTLSDLQLESSLYLCPSCCDKLMDFPASPPLTPEQGFSSSKPQPLRISKPKSYNARHHIDSPVSPLTPESDLFNNFNGDFSHRATNRALTPPQEDEEELPYKVPNLDFNYSYTRKQVPAPRSTPPSDDTYQVTPVRPTSSIYPESPKTPPAITGFYNVGKHQEYAAGPRTPPTVGGFFGRETLGVNRRSSFYEFWNPILGPHDGNGRSAGEKPRAKDV